MSGNSSKGRQLGSLRRAEQALLSLAGLAQTRPLPHGHVVFSVITAAVPSHTVYVLEQTHHCITFHYTSGN